MRVDRILSALLPSTAETLLLQACLREGAHAAQAWDRWCARQQQSGRTLQDALAETRTLLPLLGHSAVRNGLLLPPPVRSYVHAATAREQLRAERFRRIAAHALDALAEERVTGYVVRGAALAATAYPAWELRHCHDLDLIVAPVELGSATRALAAAGFSAVPPNTRDGARLRHASGLDVSVHTRPFAVDYYDMTPAVFGRDARTIAIGDAPASVAARETSLVHVLGHATYGTSRLALRWVSDAWLLIDGQGFDWARVVATVRTSRLTLPVSILVRYLADLGAAIPADVVTGIERLAAEATPAAEDVALGGAVAAVRGDLRTLWRSSGSWRGRIRLGRWMIAPSPDYVRSAFRVSSASLLPLCYLWRPVRFVTGRASQRITRALAARHT